MENRKRNERLNLRFSEEERDALYKMKEKRRFQDFCRYGDCGSQRA